MDQKQASNVTMGVLLVVIGLILFGDQLDLAWSWDMGRLWPLILIVLGVGRLMAPADGTRGFGAWLVLVGGLFLLHTWRIVSIRDSWPLFIVAFGVALLVGAWSPPPPAAKEN